MAREVSFKCETCQGPVLEATGGTVGGLVVKSGPFLYARWEDPGVHAETSLYFCSRECAAAHFQGPRA